MLNFSSTDFDSVLLYDKLSAIGGFIPAIFFIFVYFFSDDLENKSTISKRNLYLFLLPMLPFIIFSATKYNVQGLTDPPECETIAGPLYWLFAAVIIFYTAGALVIFFKKFKTKNNEAKKQLKIILYGFSFSVTWVLIINVILQIFGFPNASLLAPIGIIWLIVSISYAIVKHQFLNAKLIATQALVVALIILIASQFAFIVTTINKILTAFTLLIAIVFGWMLIRSVKKEVKRKEELEVANKKIDQKNVKLSSANREISKRKEALEVANKEISERKEQLQKMADSLAIANDKLKQLDTAKTEFIGLVNHQLLHAPTPIKDYLAMLLEGSYGEIPENQIKVLKNINAANDRQIHLTEDLMAVTRMESGKMELNFTKEKMEDICQGVYVNVEPTAKEKNLVLEYAKPKTVLPELVLDKSKIFEAIFNFVDNAVKYTPAGKIELKVELASSSNYKPQSLEDQEKKAIAGQVVRVTVSDTGSGISKENIAQLFAKFSRKDAAKLNANGTGLGLYLVKLTIEAHGGRTWAESEGEGKGSQFIIELPVKTPEEILERMADKK